MYAHSQTYLDASELSYVNDLVAGDAHFPRSVRVT